MGVPASSEYTSSPLRNRILLELKAPVSKVWELMGDLGRYPEYSSGLERVDVKMDSSGGAKEYVCRFKPQEPGGQSVSHREIMRWYEPNRGYASVPEQPNAFGLMDCLTPVTLEPSKEGTMMTWDEYYDAQDIEMNKAVFDQALADIGENLVRCFGGRVVERYVESPER